MKIEVKNNIQCYSLRDLKDGCWADIYISASGNSGTLFIQSDYGSWDYFWSHCGVPFKEFLVKLDRSYLFGKLTHGRDSYFDCDLFLKKLRDELSEMYLQQDITKAQYKNSLKEIEENLEPQCSKESITSTIYEHCNTLTDVFSNEFPSATGPHPLLIRFFEEAWLPFVNHLKEEVTA